MFISVLNDKKYINTQPFLIETMVMVSLHSPSP